jgi:glycosyltransferase involved in cell wall biosynthesis
VKDVEPLFEAMEKLVVNAELREQFGKKGREIVLSEFDEKIVIEKTLGVYEDL